MRRPGAAPTRLQLLGSGAACFQVASGYDAAASSGKGAGECPALRVAWRIVESEMLGRDEGIRLVVPIPGMLRASAGASLAILLLGCASSALVPASPGDGDLPRRPTEVLHEPCNLSDPRASALDADGDGRADVTTGRTASGICRAYDLDFDGTVDSWVYLDAAGRIRRREVDYDRDGVADEIQLYTGGALREKQLSTVRAGRLDTWQLFHPGRRQRRERDTNGDGIIDEWWFYGPSGCASIRTDEDADGKPDPRSGFEYCEGGPSPALPSSKGGEAQTAGEPDG